MDPSDSLLHTNPLFGGLELIIYDDPFAKNNSTHKGTQATQLFTATHI